MKGVTMIYKVSMVFFLLFGGKISAVYAMETGFSCRGGLSEKFILQYVFTKSDRNITFISNYQNFPIASLMKSLDVELLANYVGMGINNLQETDCKISNAPNSEVEFKCDFGKKEVFFDSPKVDFKRHAKNLVIRTESSNLGKRTVRMTMDIFDDATNKNVGNYNEAIQFTRCVEY